MGRCVTGLNLNSLDITILPPLFVNMESVNFLARLNQPARPLNMPSLSLLPVWYIIGAGLRKICRPIIRFFRVNLRREISWNFGETRSEFHITNVPILEWLHKASQKLHNCCLKWMNSLENSTVPVVNLWTKLMIPQSTQSLH